MTTRELAVARAKQILKEQRARYEGMDEPDSPVSSLEWVEEEDEEYEDVEDEEEEDEEYEDVDEEDDFALDVTGDEASEAED